MSQIVHGAGAPAANRRSRGRKRTFGNIALNLALIAGVLVFAGSPVAYILWPRWSDAVAPDAPALPITVGGMALNVPPAAIRVRLQRRAGAQERIDLVFQWPSLEPPDPAAKLTPNETPNVADRIFVKIALSDGTPPPAERFKNIYPRYTEGVPAAGPNGLHLQAFRKDTPYLNEDLLYDPTAPERFLVRCTRASGPSPGVCLHEQRIGNTDITVRFARQWLDDWRAVARDIDRLIAGLRSPASR
jgi:hypothetical protein